MKQKPGNRQKPDAKAEKRPSSSAARADSAPTPGSSVPRTMMRRIEEIGRDIAGLRAELAKLATERARERQRKGARPSS